MSKKSKTNIYDFYRQTLERPDLTEDEIYNMRRSVRLILRAILEHQYGGTFEEVEFID